MKHYNCRYCGNLVAMVNDTGRRIGCCGRDMDEITPTVARTGKHQPIATRKGNGVTVTVGPADERHPMDESHAIGWVCLVTNEGSHRKNLIPDGESEAHFPLSEGEEPIAAFAYCNVHGLFVSECK